MLASSTIYPTEKKDLYRLLKIKLTALTHQVPHLISNLSNASALLGQALTDINWAGFYLIPEYFYPDMPALFGSDISDRLILGPFQGKTACIEIKIGRGVCGTAAERDEIMIVPDVHEFPGHIACDSASRSEIVIPLHAAGKVVGVLDIDSPSPARFDEEDRAGLSEFVKILEQGF